MQPDLKTARLIVGVLLLLLPVVASEAAFAGQVPGNRLQSANLDATSFSLSRNIDFAGGSLALEAGAAEGLAASAAIRAPEWATHLGMAWTGSGALGLAVRTSPDGVTWSEWHEIVADEHLTDHETNTRYGRLISVFGGYRYIQYSAGFAHTEDASNPPALESLAFSFIQAGASRKAAQQVVTDRPAMLSRTEWGCPDGETSANNPNPTYTDVTHLIVHHTATSNDAADWAAEVRAIWSYHVQTRGWADIGYNFLIDPEGRIYVGRAGGDNVQGAHFTCQNAGTQGIALLGNFTGVQPAAAALDSLENLLAWLATREGLDAAAVSWHEGTQLNLDTISGHRDGNPSTTGCSVTSCPGDTFYPMLPGVRARVQALIADAQIPDPVIQDQDSEVVAVFTGDAQAGRGCHGLFEINDHVIANLYRAETGCRLHRIEAGGPVLLADIDTTPGLGGPTGFGTSPPLSGWHYFEGRDSEGDGLWRTDGSRFERVLAAARWPQGGVLSGRGQMNGRLYFTVRDTENRQSFFSTGGQETRDEPIPEPAANLVGSFHSRLLFIVDDPQTGREPWVFDGTEYTLLADIVPGGAGSNPRSFFPLDDHWLFVAQKPDGEHAFFRTDGETATEIPSPGSWVDVLNADDPSIKSSGALYFARRNPPPALDPLKTPTPVMRLETGTLSVYNLGNENADTASPSLAALGNHALALAENRFYRLGSHEAEELPYPFPTDQAGSDYRFIGSDPYFSHVYIEERNGEHFSQVWAWSEDEIGVLLDGEGNPVTRADHFAHIGNDIWFYGEDAENGRALRRINGAARLPPPWMAAVAGTWYDPDTSGQGFVLHPIANTRAVVSFYGYEDDGSQLWLLGTAEAPIELGVESEIVMHISSGGNFGNFIPADVETVPWGTLRITFHDCRSASAALTGDHGQQSLEMVRLAGLDGLECKAPVPPLPVLSGVSGTWYDPITAGQGLVMHAIDDNRILVSFYSYHDDSTGLWLLDVYEGQPAFGEDLTLNLTRAVGGRFGPFDPLDIERETWGTMTIRFRNCGSARATLSGIDGQQTLELLKLAGLQGSGRACPETSANSGD